jgi:hypothetical protein
MRTDATECTPDKAGCAARLPFCLPQNGSGFMVPLRFEIEPTTDLFRKMGSVWQRGAQSLQRRRTQQPEDFPGKYEKPLGGATLHNRVNASSRRFKRFERILAVSKFASLFRPRSFPSFPLSSFAFLRFCVFRFCAKNFVVALDRVKRHRAQYMHIPTCDAAKNMV